MADKSNIARTSSVENLYKIVKIVCGIVCSVVFDDSQAQNVSKSLIDIWKPIYICICEVWVIKWIKLCSYLDSTA